MLLGRKSIEEPSDDVDGWLFVSVGVIDKDWKFIVQRTIFESCQHFCWFSKGDFIGCIEIVVNTLLVGADDTKLDITTLGTLSDVLNLYQAIRFSILSTLFDSCQHFIVGMEIFVGTKDNILANSQAKIFAGSD